MLKEWDNPKIKAEKVAFNLQNDYIYNVNQKITGANHYRLASELIELRKGSNGWSKKN